MAITQTPSAGRAQKGSAAHTDKDRELVTSPLTRHFLRMAGHPQFSDHSPAEKAADETAAQVTGNGKPAIQRKSESPSTTYGGPTLSQLGPGFSSTLQSSGGGKSLDNNLPNSFRSTFGDQLDRVRIHEDEKADQLSRSINAKAFTHQNDIYFRKGEYDTGSSEGQELLAHELAHTVQQKGSENGQSSAGAVQRKEASPTVDTPEFELERNKGSMVSLGTDVTYMLQKKGTDELAYGYTYNWKVIDAKGGTFYAQTTWTPMISLEATVPGDYIVQVQILKDGEWIDQAYLEQNVYFKESHTDLGGLFVGNFDFVYNGNKVDVRTRFKFKFESGITKTEKEDFKTKFFSAIEEYWTNAGVSFVADGDCAVDEVPLNITAKESTSDYHKIVDVVRDYKRPDVVYDMNLYLGISKKTIAHEYGHVLGLYDEYAAPWYEDFWHDTNHESDTDALMNTGTEQRRRYFTRFLSTVNAHTAKGCKYKLKAPFTK